MAQRQDQDVGLPDTQAGTGCAGGVAPTAEPEYLIPDVSDADILAEWDRKLMQPDYVPLLRGRRLEDMQGPLLDTILQNVDEFTACRLPQCAFVGRTRI
eukprot:10192985-Alexandrium_andersonii.AAC.1